MADDEVKIGVGLDTSQAEKDAEDAAKKIRRTFDDVISSAKVKGGRWWEAIGNKPTKNNPVNLKKYRDALKPTQRMYDVVAKGRRGLKEGQKMTYDNYVAQISEYKKYNRMYESLQNSKAADKADVKQSINKSRERASARAAEKAAAEAQKKAEFDAAYARGREEDIRRGHEKAIADRWAEIQQAAYNAQIENPASKEVLAAMGRMYEADEQKTAEQIKEIYAGIKIEHRKDYTGGLETFAQNMARLDGEAESAPTNFYQRWKKSIESISNRVDPLVKKFRELNGLGYKGDTSNRPVTPFEKAFWAGKNALKLGGKGAKLAFKGAGMIARGPGAMLGGLNEKFGKKLGGGFDFASTKLGRFARQFSRAFRFKAIRQAVSAILRLMKQGLKNLDEYSQHMGTPFHQNVLKLASSLLYLKNAFAAMVAPIINAVTPALERLMDTLAKLANHIGALFAGLTGQEQFTAALKKTVTKTQAAAGKLKDILAFDELNRLSGDTGSGENVDEMFEEWGGKDFFKEIADTFKSGQWNKLGKEFAKRVNNIIKNFDAQKLGAEIGSKLGAAISFASSFFENLSFSTMGSKVAEWFSNMIKKINWKDLGRLIARKFTAAIDFFGSLIGDLDWGSVARALSDTISGLFNGLGDWLKKVNWVKVGYELTNNIITFIENIKWGEVAQAIVNLLEGAVRAVAGVIGGLIERVLGIEIPDWLKNLFGKGSAEVSLTAEISESVETHFNEESKGLFQSLLSFLGGGSSDDPADAGTMAWAVGEAVAEALKSPALAESSLLGDYNVPVTEQTLAEAKGIGTTLRSILEKVGLIKPQVEYSASCLRQLLNKSTTSLPSVGTTSTKLMGGIIGRASGGTVDKGQLFIANEAGPELIGNVGGKTTVTNQDQFTQGLIDANSYVVDAVLQVVKAVNNKNFDVYMDSQKVGKSVTNYQNNASRRYGV